MFHACVCIHTYSYYMLFIHVITKLLIFIYIYNNIYSSSSSGGENEAYYGFRTNEAYYLFIYYEGILNFIWVRHFFMHNCYP